MLLINPPVVKPSEPPAGIAKACGRPCREQCSVQSAGREHRRTALPDGTAGHRVRHLGRRAIRNSADNLAALRGPATYRSLDRYKRAVRDMDRLLALASGDQGDSIGLSDHQHPLFSPLRSDDLIAVAEHHERNPFTLYFGTDCGRSSDRDPRRWSASP